RVVGSKTCEKNKTFQDSTPRDLSSRWGSAFFVPYVDFKESAAFVGRFHHLVPRAADTCVSFRLHRLAGAHAVNHPSKLYLSARQFADLDRWPARRAGLEPGAVDG